MPTSFQKSSRCLLNESMDAASTTDGGGWFQASMTLCEKVSAITSLAWTASTVCVGMWPSVSLTWDELR